MELLSTNKKVEKCRSLTPHDLTNWEKQFMESVERAALAEKIGDLTDKQLDVLDQIYEKHFR
jgi:TorA maturation chaperone TorD